MQSTAGPDVAWQPVSPALAAVRTVEVAVLTGLPTAIVAGLLWWRASPTVAAIITAVGAAAVLVAVLLARRGARAWAYAEGAEELLVRRGRLFRRLVVVPYGRMQLVDVVTGPLSRAFGIATVQLHTAAASTHAHIAGVPVADAELLRQRLTARGEARAAGL